MANLRKVIYINEEDYSTLINGDSLVIDGTTYTYEENALYVIKNAGPPEYAETAGYATNAGTSLVAVTDASGNNIAATYGKKPLIIEANYSNNGSKLQQGTYDAITGALALDRLVILKLIFDKDDDQIYYLPLLIDYANRLAIYYFRSLSGYTSYSFEINGQDEFYIFQNTLASDGNVVHKADTETITGNKTFTGTVSLGSNATATTPATTDNDTSVATTAFVHNVINALPEITTGHIVGRMHRDNVSGTGNLTITGASGEGFSPNGITTAGKYIVVVYSWSDTKTFGYNISFGSNSYTLSTTDGTISDKRELTVSAGALWSGSVTVAVSAGTTIIVEIYKSEKTTQALSVGTVALTNLYNDLDGKPTISSSTSSTSTTDIASSKAVKSAYDHGGVQSVNGLTGNVNLTLGDANTIESISVNGVALTITNKNVDIILSTEVDSELDPESTNPVENQAIFNELYKKQEFNSNGFNYIDLGLPSGNLWAEYNLNTTNNYTISYTNKYGWAALSANETAYWDNDHYTKYTLEDQLSELEIIDDAARNTMLGSWQIPSEKDWQELFDICTFEETAVLATDAVKITGPNGNSIYIPYSDTDNPGVSGHYWTSTLTNTSDVRFAKCVIFTKNLHEIIDYARANHINIRPIIKINYIYSFEGIKEITYKDLKNLKNNNGLIPGKYYRIIDYVTTADGIDNSEIVSACHPFDIIVRADGANTLNENAYAAVHAGDTYFANSNLAAWKLKYTIDRGDFTGCPINDYSYKAMICKYLDSSNNPHYYLYMYDSVGNLFILYYFNDETFTKVSNYGTVIDLRCAHFNMNANTYYGYIESTNPNSITIGDTVVDFNNVSYEVVDIAEIKYEFKGWIYYMKDENENECSYDFKNILFNVPRSSKLLDKSDYLDLEEIYYTFNYDNKDASLGGNYDKYPPSVFNNKIAVTSGIMYNVFRCTSSRGTTISYNILDEECSECIFRDTGSGIRGRIDNNHIGKKCNNIIVNGGKTTAYICDNCNNITLGNNNATIIIQLNCNNITFGTSKGTKNYYRNIIIEPGNQYIYLNNTQTTSSSKYCQNIKICQGVNNTTTWKLIDVDVVNNQYQIEYKNANSKTITV